MPLINLFMPTEDKLSLFFSSFLIAYQLSDNYRSGTHINESGSSCLQGTHNLVKTEYAQLYFKVCDGYGGKTKLNQRRNGDTQ